MAREVRHEARMRRIQINEKASGYWLAASPLISNLLGKLGDADFVATTLGYPDWLRAMLGFLADPPGYVLLPMVAMVCYLLLSDQRKKSATDKEAILNRLEAMFTKFDRDYQDLLRNIEDTARANADAHKEHAEGLVEMEKRLSEQQGRALYHSQSQIDDEINRIKGLIKGINISMQRLEAPSQKAQDSSPPLPPDTEAETQP
jgi:hypothetical protein